MLLSFQLVSSQIGGKGLMLGSGVLANLSTAPFIVWIALRLQDTGHDYAYFFFSALAVFSIAAVTQRKLPFQVGGSGAYTDGAQILQLITHSPALAYKRAINRLQSTLFTPLRHRDLDPIVFQRLAVERSGHLSGLHAHLCAAVIIKA